MYITELLSYGTSKLHFTIPRTIFTSPEILEKETFVEKVPYKFFVNLEIEMASPISSVDLINHKELNVELSGTFQILFIYFLLFNYLLFQFIF